MSETLTARGESSLRKIIRRIFTAIAIVAGVAAIIALVGWFMLRPQTLKSNGFERFDGAVTTQGILVKTGLQYDYYAEFTLFRVGKYHVYPAETYTGELWVTNSVGPVQTFTLVSSEETMSQRIKVQWQWETGSIAQKTNLRPESIQLNLRRQRDGRVESSFQRMPVYE